MAAEHFALLIVGKPIDHALFLGGSQVRAELNPAAYVRAGVDVFIAGYRAH